MPNTAFQPPKKEKLTGILAIVLYLVMGLLLLVKPEWMMDFTRYALCAALMAYAALSFRKYLNTPAEEAAKGYGLTGAMISATLAVLALFEAAVPMDHFWGILLLAGGYMKFQTAMDMGRLGHQRWWLFMIPSGISLIFGLLIITEIIPSGNTAPLIGAALIVEGLVDIAAMVMIARSDKLNQKSEKQTKEEESAKAPSEQPAEKKEEAPEEKAAESSES